jgi:hypothetical protein
MTLKTDPRADPRMLAALAEFGFDEPPSQPPVTAASPHEEILDFLAAAEHVYENVFKEWFSGLSPIENVERRTEVITAWMTTTSRSMFTNRATRLAASRACTTFTAVAWPFCRRRTISTRAGVSVYSRTVNGTCHNGDMAFRKAMPEVFAATIRDIKGFADSLSSVTGPTLGWPVL